MKTLKKLLPIFALLLGFTLVFTQSAFTVKKDGTRYRYKLNTAVGVDVVTNWEEITSTEPSCGFESDLPCVIMVNGSLTDYLQDNNTVAKIQSSSELESSKGITE